LYPFSGEKKCDLLFKRYLLEARTTELSLQLLRLEHRREEWRSTRHDSGRVGREGG
jgi:hypothetical protein